MGSRIGCRSEVGYPSWNMVHLGGHVAVIHGCVVGVLLLFSLTLFIDHVKRLPAHRPTSPLPLVHRAMRFVFKDPNIPYQGGPHAWTVLRLKIYAPRYDHSDDLEPEMGA